MVHECLGSIPLRFPFSGRFSLFSSFQLDCTTLITMPVSSVLVTRSLFDQVLTRQERLGSPTGLWVILGILHAQ